MDENTSHMYGVAVDCIKSWLAAVKTAEVVTIKRHALHNIILSAVDAMALLEGEEPQVAPWRWEDYFERARATDPDDGKSIVG